ncbi:Ig-like domain-containing protein [Pseudomonas orientalis]|uniref:Ig-like domain (Group 2) n=1 Tax=Pseudomonas orientalis TaxID=76758 RepID=A0A1H2FNN9_9PSED|nr:Ig-like domain-containing protein [Pseudomonas orientalis]KRP65157.1 bacterial Ig-like domain protein [Pseudomonas orientalis]SDU08932.1 Ig-like domain (group 2) [Pseudomonas orientalis]
MKPNQYVAPHVDTVKWNINAIDDNNASIHFHTADVRSETLAATDPSVYVEALIEAAEEYLNGDEWREAAMEKTPCEFRPTGAEATGQQIIVMADRTVTFDPRKNWDNQTIEKGEVLAGSIIFTEPTDTALVISHRVTILDHNLIAGFTEDSLAQTADKILRDIELSAAGKIAGILSTAPSTEAISEIKPTGKPVEIAEDLIDLLTTHINQTVGTSLADFVVLLPVSLVAVLERAAQRAGVGDIEDLIGASVQPYSGTDYGLFLLPKMFTSLSYRENREGDIWKIQATRNGNAQAWDIEIMTVVDIVANGKVKVKLTEDGLQTETVAFPMITNLKLFTPVSGVSLKSASKDLVVGASYTNIATVAPANATNQGVTWATSDASVASVSTAGSVKGLEVGEATITATTVDGGFSASYAVNVTAAA